MQEAYRSGLRDALHIAQQETTKSDIIAGLQRRIAECDGGDRDPLLDAAVKVARESDRVTISTLQRRLAIGYVRASELFERMKRDGVLAEIPGDKLGACFVDMTRASAPAPGGGGA